VPGTATAGRQRSVGGRAGIPLGLQRVGRAGEPSKHTPFRGPSVRACGTRHRRGAKRPGHACGLPPSRLGQHAHLQHAQRVIGQRLEALVGLAQLDPCLGRNVARRHAAAQLLDGLLHPLPHLLVQAVALEPNLALHNVHRVEEGAAAATAGTVATAGAVAPPVGSALAPGCCRGGYCGVGALQGGAGRRCAGASRRKGRPSPHVGRNTRDQCPIHPQALPHWEAQAGGTRPVHAELISIGSAARPSRTPHGSQ
jgi:hypothetical protein